MKEVNPTNAHNWIGYLNKPFTTYNQSTIDDYEYLAKNMEETHMNLILNYSIKLKMLTGWGIAHCEQNLHFLKCYQMLFATDVSVYSQKGF